MFCTKCGVNNADTTTYCVSCGNTLEKVETPVQEAPAPIPAPVPVQPQASIYPTQPHQSYATGNYGYQTYNQPSAKNNELEKPVTVGDWMLTYLIMLIPIVGFIMMFVWAFGGGTPKSKSNYFKAMLIWTGIIIGLYILAIILIFVFAAVFANSW